MEAFGTMVPPACTPMNPRELPRLHHQHREFSWVRGKFVDRHGTYTDRAVSGTSCVRNVPAATRQDRSLR